MGVSRRKVRNPIPDGVSTRVRFAADDTCCKCRMSGRRTQIHHLDGDPSNNRDENLVVLCVLCHDRAEQTGGVGRRLDPGLIRSYRDDWLATVAARRERQKHGRRREPPINLVLSPGSDGATEDQLDLLGAVEVRKVLHAVELALPDWAKVAELISGLGLCARDYSHVTRREIIRVGYALSCEARNGMTGDLAWRVRGMVSEALPMFFTEEQRLRGPTAKQLQLLNFGASVGRGLAYDGIRYLGDFKVARSGSSLMAEVLREAVKTKHKELTVSVESDFEEMIDWARKAGRVDSLRWLPFERDEARAQGSGNFESVRDLLRA